MATTKNREGFPQDGTQGSPAEAPRRNSNNYCGASTNAAQHHRSRLRARQRDNKQQGGQGDDVTSSGNHRSRDIVGIPAETHRARSQQQGDDQHDKRGEQTAQNADHQE